MSGPAEPTHYEVLGVPVDVSPLELRRHYRRLVREHHPDRAPAGEQRTAAVRTAAIVAAYRVLADPESRQRYDVEASIPRQGKGEVRTAARPWAVDLPPRPTHDPVLRTVPGRSHGPPRRPLPDPPTPLADTLPRLALAGLVGLFGLVAVVAGGAAGLAALQVVGVVLVGAGIVGVLLSELARKDDG